MLCSNTFHRDFVRSSVLPQAHSPIRRCSAQPTTLQFLPKSGGSKCLRRARELSLSTRAEEETSNAPIGARYVQVTLKRPLGMTLAEDAKRKLVFVEELAQGGNAESSGKVVVGDIVSKVSATVLKAGKDGQYEKEGYGQRPYDNWDKVMFDCTGQDFKTVMSAIDSNNPRWGINDVTLVLQRERQ